MNLPKTDLTNEKIDEILPMEWWVCFDNEYTIVKYDRDDLIEQLADLVHQAEIKARIDELDKADSQYNEESIPLWQYFNERREALEKEIVA